MLNLLLKLRYLVIVIVIFSFLNSLVLMFLAAKRSIHAYGIVFFNVKGDKPPGIEILESIDLFLIGLVFLIFSLGLTKIFLGKLSEDEDESKIPKWLRIKNFMELKILLWQTIIVSLVIFFVDQIVEAQGELEWDILIIPVSILVLAASMGIIKKIETE